MHNKHSSTQVEDGSRRGKKELKYSRDKNAGQEPYRSGQGREEKNKDEYNKQDGEKKKGQWSGHITWF